MEELIKQFPIIGYIFLWALVGFLLGPIMAKPLTKKQAICQLFMCGPWAWILFIPISIRFIYKQNRNL